MLVQILDLRFGIVNYISFPEFAKMFCNPRF